MNDIVIGVWVTAATTGTGAGVWILYCLRADGGWHPPVAEPLWFGWLRAPWTTKRIRSAVKTDPVTE